VTSTFEALRQFLYERSGLSLEGDKLYLVESRLLPIAREFGLADLPSLLKRLQTGDRDLAQAVVEAMTTNETFFFRDRVPFDKFRSVILPELLAARAAERRLRIWCAACSTGQEPYLLAMLLDEEARRFTGWSVVYRAVPSKPRGGALQPIRGAARPADRAPDQILHAGRRCLADRAGAARHGPVSSPQPARRFRPPRHF